ncbi:chloride channel protein [Sphaerotilus sp.]|uniref:chloride channel protein n=1 Tax=Sphaerotilus sp. TaxID=2093942 RepID=UPI002ACEDE78|nr:chloride channel protein [Sphaerotilus sp.]MDZ7855217.1 chloride channel protein [Sphaerotilus sp.]
MPTPDRSPSWRVLFQALREGHRWRDQTVVLVYAVLTGLTVVGFTMLTEVATDTYMQLRGAGTFGALLALVWTPLLTVAILMWTRRFAPTAAGSGIPQVIAALHDEIPPAQASALVSLRLALHKVVLTSAGMLGGLSIGREGPTVQVGAGVMQHARRWLSPGSGIDAHDLMVAGAAAGVAAAFNTPLGGIVFAIEQLTRRRHLQHSHLTIAAIVLAGLVSISVFGNHSYFGALVVPRLDWALLGPGLVVALVAGLAGGLFATLMVVCAQGGDRISQWRSRHPLRFAAACGLAVAVIGAVTGGATAGAGYHPTRALLEHGEDGLPPLYTLLKFVATWLSAWSGVPAGVFAPSLAIGAGLGHDVARLVGLAGRPEAVALVALGMVGFLSASTQGPITAFIIVMEMVSGQAMVLSLMACALLSGGVARLVSPPMYTELALRWGMPPATRPPSG